MIIQCNGLFPSVTKNGDQYIGGVVDVGSRKFFARANVAPGSISLSLSEMLEGGAYRNSGTVIGIHHGKGNFSFDLDGSKLTLAVRRVKEKGKKFPVGTVFLGATSLAEPASQATLASFLEDEAPELPDEPMPSRRRAPARKRSRSRARA